MNSTVEACPTCGSTTDWEAKRARADGVTLLRNFALAAALLLPATAQACDIVKDPQPTWEQMIDESDVVFVGTAVATRQTTSPDWSDTVVFAVELPVKGVGEAQFEFRQGTSSCDHFFDVGSHVIFAGRNLGFLDGAPHIFVEDTGWDPTVTLTDPPTAAQLAQLNYLKQIAEDHSEGPKQ
jgi:hypothetical protein